MAEWLISYYQANSIKTLGKSGLVDYSEWEEAVNIESFIYAIEESLKLKPTAGLGITDSDLEEIGAESYEQVDSILQEILAWKRLKLHKGFEAFDKEVNCETFLDEQQILNIPYPIIEAVAIRHFRSEFKRKQLPIKISRHEIMV